jgi:hypothetical protein
MFKQRSVFILTSVIGPYITSTDLAVLASNVLRKQTSCTGLETKSELSVGNKINTLGS